MTEQNGAKLVRTFFDNISAHDLSANDVLKGDGYVFEGPGLTALLPGRANHSRPDEGATEAITPSTSGGLQSFRLGKGPLGAVTEHLQRAV
jgi:hypothetical protein